MTRRELVRGLCAGAGPGLALRWSGAGLGLASCSRPAAVVMADARRQPTGRRSARTWIDPDGSGVLRVGAGEPLLARTELGPASPARRVLATLAHVTDAHVLDAQSPARAPFLARLGPPFSSTFRPQETLTAQVLAGMLAAVDRAGPRRRHPGRRPDRQRAGQRARPGARRARRRRVAPGSGGARLPRRAGGARRRPLLLPPRPRRAAPSRAARRRRRGPFVSAGLRRRGYPVLGDHDLLVAGDPRADRADRARSPAASAPSGTCRASCRRRRAARPELAVGTRRARPIRRRSSSSSRSCWARPGVDVPADPRRRRAIGGEAIGRLRAGERRLPRGGPQLDYSFDLGASVRVIVLDLVRRAGGSGGVVRAGPAGLAGRGSWRRAGDRWVLVVTHQPLTNVGRRRPGLLAEIDRSPRVLAALYGHTHRNRITPRRTRAAADTG